METVQDWHPIHESNSLSNPMYARSSKFPTPSPVQSKFLSGRSMAPPPFQLKSDGEKGAEKCRRKDKGTNKGNKGYSEHKHKSVIVTIPEGSAKSYPILMIYGGLRYATREWMMKQIPSSYFKSHILVFANWGSTYASKAGPHHKEVLKRECVSGTYKGLIGFSKGGNPVARGKNDESWGNIGLIDPEITGYTKGFSTNVYMVWNTWGGKSEKVDARARFHRKIKAGKEPGDSVRLKISHADMVSAFFSKYGSNF